jgi:hypothetical protein
MSNLDFQVTTTVGTSLRFADESETIKNIVVELHTTDGLLTLEMSKTVANNLVGIIEGFARG